MGAFCGPWTRGHSQPGESDAPSPAHSGCAAARPARPAASPVGREAKPAQGVPREGVSSEVPGATRESSGKRSHRECSPPSLRAAQALPARASALSQLRGPDRDGHSTGGPAKYRQAAAGVCRGPALNSTHHGVVLNDVKNVRQVSPVCPEGNSPGPTLAPARQLLRGHRQMAKPSAASRSGAALGRCAASVVGRETKQQNNPPLSSRGHIILPALIGQAVSSEGSRGRGGTTDI